MTKQTSDLFRGKRAVGVEYVPNSRFHPTAKHKVRVARARRLVVVSAGAFGSPAILERSGIGGSLVLRNNSITAVVDLPGVGENYQGKKDLTYGSKNLG